MNPMKYRRRRWTASISSIMRQVQVGPPEQAISQDDGACRFRVDERASREGTPDQRSHAEAASQQYHAKAERKSVAKPAWIAHVLDMRG